MQDWDAAYRRGETPWELGEPAPPLLDLARDHLSRLGRVLIPGCGRGDDALAIASLGANVTGWDLAPTAIAAAQERARVGSLPATFVVRDALHPTAANAGTFDTWIEHTFFTALAPERRPQYAAAAATLLRPGGLILGLYYCDDVTGGPPFAIREEELRALVAPAFHVVTLATATNSADRWAGRELAAVLERRADH